MTISNWDLYKVGHCANRNSCVFDESIDDHFGRKEDAVTNHHNVCRGTACYDYCPKNSDAK